MRLRNLLRTHCNLWLTFWCQGSLPNQHHRRLLLALWSCWRRTILCQEYLSSIAALYWLLAYEALLVQLDWREFSQLWGSCVQGPFWKDGGPLPPTRNIKMIQFALGHAQWAHILITIDCYCHISDRAVASRLQVMWNVFHLIALWDMKLRYYQNGHVPRILRRHSSEPMNL